MQSMQNYMNSERFVVKDIQVCDPAGWYGAILKDGKIFSKMFSEEVTHLIGQLVITFYKS